MNCATIRLMNKVIVNFAYSYGNFICQFIKAVAKKYQERHTNIVVA